MKTLDLVRTAINNLKRRRLRSTLTVFGVMIAAALITLLVSMGIGLRHFLTDQVESIMPEDVILVVSTQGSFQIGLAGLAFGDNPQQVSDNTSSRYSLTPLRADQVAKIETMDHVARVDPYILFSAWSVRLKDSSGDFKTQVRTMPDYQLTQRSLEAGGYFDAEDEGSCIIAHGFLETFGFGSAEDALGQEILVMVRQVGSLFGLPAKSQEFALTVVGVASNNMRANEILVPRKDAEAMARFWADSPELYTDGVTPSILQVRVEDTAHLETVIEEIKDLKLGAIASPQVVGVVGNLFNVIEGVLGAFGFTALAVASLGIMNTLVMATHERTREIGIMKATGASRTLILKLFTLEGLLIGLMGGSLGVLVGYGAGIAINRMSQLTFLQEFGGLQIAVFPTWLLAGVLAISVLVALLAALYPSVRAARLNPVDALRFE